VENLFTKTFPSPPNIVTIQEFKEVAQKLKETIHSDITKWTFDDLHRDENGSFCDSDLARILQDGTTNPAGAFKARGTPAAMRIIEVMTICQARAWGCCTVGVLRSVVVHALTSCSSMSSGSPLASSVSLLFCSSTSGSYLSSIHIIPRVEPEEGDLGVYFLPKT
jgi:hypothetical protein